MNNDFSLLCLPLYRSINLTRGFKVSSFVSKSFNDSWSGCIKTLRVPQRKSLSSTRTLVNSQTCLTRLTRSRSDGNFDNYAIDAKFRGLKFLISARIYKCFFVLLIQALVNVVNSSVDVLEQTVSKAEKDLEPSTLRKVMSVIPGMVSSAVKFYQ